MCTPLTITCWPSLTDRRASAIVPCWTIRACSS